MILVEQNVCLNVGEEAPDFSLIGHDGNRVRLSSFRGKNNVVLAIHAGKLEQACKDYIHFFSDHLPEFEEAGTQVIAVNMDTVEANREWAEQIGGLGFPLLSDFSPVGGVTLKYDCFVPKQGYGKRAVFLIDKKGRIQHIEVLSGKHGACPNMDSLLEAARRLM
jgi:peroxiredoxin